MQLNTEQIKQLQRQETIDLWLHQVTGTASARLAIKDINGISLEPSHTIDIHQTVNGQNLFWIKTINPLDIRYSYDPTRKYEYDQLELIDQDQRGRANGPTFEILNPDYGTQGAPFDEPGALNPDKQNPCTK